MDIDTILAWHARRKWQGYAAAVVVFFLVLAGRHFIMSAELSRQMPFAFFYISLGISAWYGGLGPGLLATALGTVAATCYIQKLGHLQHDVEMQMRTVMFVFSGILLSFLFESLHVTRKRMMYKKSMLEMEIAQRHKAQEAQVDANRRKDEFMATLAHELRGPLGAASNALEVMEVAKDDGVKGKAMSIMRRQISQMTRLIDDLMDIARVSQNKIELKKQPLQLSTVIQTAVDGVKPMMEGKSHDVTVSLPQEPVWIDGDPARLNQIFMNILANAAKYTAPRGDISISAERENEKVKIVVRDNGVGIPAHILPKIFDMYVQAESTLEQSQGGLGIGLSLVKRLVTLHGGLVTARSAGTGKGSEFEVTLPVMQITTIPAPRPEKRKVETEIRHCVLVVDDNEASAQTLGWMMEGLGHQVKVATSGQEAIRTAAAFHPDVVLLDIGLPEMDGYEVCKAMRQMPTLKDTVIIAQTGWGQPEEKKRAEEAGFDHHLVKPIELAALQNVLNSFSGRPCSADRPLKDSYH
jgi:signal transduction histidine kinase/CheY-like chemotaxis protein